MMVRAGLPHLSRRRFFLTAGAVGAGLWVAHNSVAAEVPPLAPPDQQPPNLDVPEPVARKAGWAIVGLGTLALEEVMPAFAHCRLSKPVALVSGHPEKARQVAQVYNINAKHIYSYDTYERLADNPDVDAIYIILPNSMHAEYTIRGLQAGKHVLCEKPMATSVDECEHMMGASEETAKQLMIAYRLHYEPFNRKVMEWCTQKTFGAVTTISASNCQITTAPNIRLSRALGGGPVQDIGIYIINAARYITGEEPSEVQAMAQQPPEDPRFREVPASVAFTLRFPSGVLAHGDCSFASEESRRYRVNCTQGLIELDPAFSYRGLRLSSKAGNGWTELRLREVNQFAAEMDHFSDCILNHREPRTPGGEGLADLRVIRAIEEAIRTGESVPLRTPAAAQSATAPA
jgi:predicted dehydrogenase